MRQLRSLTWGMSILTLRGPAGLFSVAALMPFYLLLRRALAAPAALLTTWLLATNIWYLHFSRSGWENIEGCLFLMAALLCMREAVRRGQARFFFGAGVWAAFGAYGYPAGRAIFAAALLIALLALLRPRVPRRRLVAGILVTATTAFVLYAP